MAGALTAAAGIATGGASVPITAILEGIGGLSGLMGLLGMGDSPQDEASKYALEQLKAMMPSLQQTAYSKDEIGGLVDSFKRSVGISTDIAKTKMGTSLAEGMGAAGVPQGQPSASMYVSELAPLDANAVSQKAGIDKWGAEFWASLDSDAKNRTLQALNSLAGVSGMQSDLTGGQKGVITFLQAFDLLSKGGGNLADMFKNLNWQNIDPTSSAKKK